MPKVWADNEEVIFEDGMPTDPKRIYELMMGALAEQGRAVIEYTVDGDDALTGTVFPSSFDEIKAKSMSHHEITLRLAKENLQLIDNLCAQIDAYSRNILNTPWSEVFKRMDSLIEKIQPFADLIDNVSPYANTYSPPWSDGIKNLASLQGEILSSMLKSFEDGDPAGLSDLITIRFVPLVKRISKFFREDVIPHLENLVPPPAKSAENSNA